MLIIILSNYKQCPLLLSGLAGSLTTFLQRACFSCRCLSVFNCTQEVTPSTLKSLISKKEILRKCQRVSAGKPDGRPLWQALVSSEVRFDLQGPADCPEALKILSHHQGGLHWLPAAQQRISISLGNRNSINSRVWLHLSVC